MKDSLYVTHVASIRCKIEGMPNFSEDYSLHLEIWRAMNQPVFGIMHVIEEMCGKMCLVKKNKWTAAGIAYVSRLQSVALCQTE